MGGLLELVPALRWRGSAAAPTSEPMASVMRPIELARGAVIVCEGDSLTSGSDRIESLPALFGPRRPDAPYTVALAEALGPDAIVVNRGVGGHQAQDGLLLWRDAPSGDLAIIMYGGNDASHRTGGRRAIPLEDFRRAMRALVERRQRGGAHVLVMASPQVGARAGERAIAPFRVAAREVALETGALFIDARRFLLGLPAPLKVDGIHLRPCASRAIGQGVAALIRIGD